MAQRLSESFRSLRIELSLHDFNLGHLFEKLGAKSHAFVIVILAFPFFTPIPVPGLSTVMGIMASFVVFSWYRRQEIWLPVKWKTYILPVKIFSKVFEYGEKYSLKFEHLFKARGQAFLQISLVRFLLFFLILVSAIFLALPLPPGTNLPPALAMAVLSLAILFEDVVLLFLGLLIFCVQAYIICVTVWFLFTKALPYIQSFL
ncbi:MAG: exopolysaccharide biosynthesis protein [Bdellovibrio sp.]|nr:exopolysaccharide biosynthesis protein [Bdellovibrio sp.]